MTTLPRVGFRLQGFGRFDGLDDIGQQMAFHGKRVDGRLEAMAHDELGIYVESRIDRGQGGRRERHGLVQSFFKDIQHLAVRRRCRQTSGIALLHVCPRYASLISHREHGLLNAATPRMARWMDLGLLFGGFRHFPVR